MGLPTTRPSLISSTAPSPSWTEWWLHSSSREEEEEEEEEGEAGVVIKAVVARMAEVQVAARQLGAKPGKD